MSEADSRSAAALDKRIGQRVRERRLEIGMSQERLAEILGVTFQQVQKYEKGVNRIAMSRGWDIAVALETSPMTFYDRSEFKPSVKIQELLEQSEIQKALIVLSKQTPKTRKKALELIEALG